MKALALTISLLILTVAAFAQNTPKAELALGTYVGAGKVEGQRGGLALPIAAAHRNVELLGWIVADLELIERRVRSIMVKAV